MTAPAAARPPRLVVFTDLDGTLLDARTYSAAPARGALARLAAAGVPVVFCSSKTAAEQRPLREELGLTQVPYIVENGAAIIVPAAAGLALGEGGIAGADEGERVWALGRPFAEVKAGLRRAAAAAGVKATGYAELTVAEIAARTGLDLPAAARARQRDYSETLVDTWPEAEWTKLAAALAAEGLQAAHGGRFRTVTSVNVDKGRAVRWLAERYAATGPVVTAGLGDAANDASLLAAVDRPYLLASRDGGWAEIGVPGVRKIAAAGPAGWSEAIAELLGET